MSTRLKLVTFVLAAPAICPCFTLRPLLIRRHNSTIFSRYACDNGGKLTVGVNCENPVNYSKSDNVFPNCTQGIELQTHWSLLVFTQG